ncbi:hypothetical protein EOE48_04655 [Methylobacterium oryzihabitans]|uniref:Exopolysaccharide production protein YjbE n=2 Tax=Methylobacterium oryzihabitans TaxID=2499852 RepID=A0A437PEX5_9HYPH|nr:hypothetical protein EOE48_04655 [Methylobacterium oryzihabitans]
MRMTTLAGTCAILVMSAAAAVAGPCAPGQQANAQNRSSTVDPPSTATVTPGAKAESPGTVGAMQNVGANATSPSDVAKQSKGEKTAAQEANNC